MNERRVETRLLCADLVKVEWRDPAGVHSLDANLEDICLTGACIQTDDPIPPGVRVMIRHSRGRLMGTIRHCTFREIGYFAGVEFEPESKWSLRQFRPLHLLDPRRLARRVSDRLRSDRTDIH